MKISWLLVDAEEVDQVDVEVIILFRAIASTFHEQQTSFSKSLPRRGFWNGCLDVSIPMRLQRVCSFDETPILSKTTVCHSAGHQD